MVHPCTAMRWVEQQSANRLLPSNKFLSFRSSIYIILISVTVIHLVGYQLLKIWFCWTDTTKVLIATTFQLSNFNCSFIMCKIISDLKLKQTHRQLEGCHQTQFRRKYEIRACFWELFLKGSADIQWQGQGKQNT